MATTPIKWTRVTIRVTTLLGTTHSVELRTVKTGRGKAAVERWQRKASSDLYLDGDTPQEGAERLLAAGKELTDARIEIDTWDDSHSMKVTGWSEDVSEEHIEAGRAQLIAVEAALQATKAAQEAADKAKLLSWRASTRTH
jgi:hypothetical protein